MAWRRHRHRSGPVVTAAGSPRKPTWVTWLHNRHRWVVVLEDKDTGIRLAKLFWTRWRAGAYLHHVANTPAMSELFIPDVIDRKANG